jgi:hypothetical protein
MNLLFEVRDQVQAYLDGSQSLGDLDYWLAGYVQAIADADDERVRRLVGRAWLLIDELGYGHRDEASVRDELAAALQRLGLVPLPASLTPT